MKKIMIALCMFMLFACSSASSPETVVNKLYESMNDVDLEGVLDCIEPRKVEEIEAAVKFTSFFTGIELSVEDICAMFGMLDPNDPSLIKFEYEIIDVEYYDNNTRAVVEVISNGNYMYYDLINEDGNWYVILD